MNVEAFSWHAKRYGLSVGTWGIPTLTMGRVSVVTSQCKMGWQKKLSKFSVYKVQKDHAII